MIIAIGNDHAGVEVKEKIQQHLINNGHQVINKGYDGEESVDYPDFIHPVSIDVKEKKADIGGYCLWEWKRCGNDSKQTRRDKSGNLLERRNSIFSKKTQQRKHYKHSFKIFKR